MSKQRPHLAPTVIAALLATAHTAHADLAAGPMLGHVDMREAIVWAQAEQPSELSVTYSPQGETTRYTAKSVSVEATTAYTAQLVLDQVEPGTTYNYQVLENGQPVGEQYNFTTPSNYLDRSPPPDFKFAVGGAHYAIQDGYEPPYKLLGGGYGIFQTIAQTKPQLMIWAGNTAHLRDSDWASRSGVLKRYSHARAIPELKQLLATVPNYATWGNADYSTRDAGAHYTFREHTEDAFKAFWPSPAEVSALDGIATRFRYSDVEFFMLDVRSYRDDLPDSKSLPTILGDEQIAWLRQELIRSTATFKIIIAGAPILNPADNPLNLSSADREHTRLLEMLRSEQIDGLFCISGGKYYGELTKLVHASSYNLYDLTVGPTTATPQENSDELNFFRVPNSTVEERHFALIEVSGPEEDRLLTVRAMSMEGSELWNRKIKATDLISPNKE